LRPEDLFPKEISESQIAEILDLDQEMLNKGLGQFYEERKRKLPKK